MTGDPIAIEGTVNAAFESSPNLLADPDTIGQFLDTSTTFNIQGPQAGVALSPIYTLPNHSVTKFDTVENSRLSIKYNDTAIKSVRAQCSELGVV